MKLPAKVKHVVVSVLNALSTYQPRTEFKCEYSLDKGDIERGICCAIEQAIIRHAHDEYYEMDHDYEDILKPAFEAWPECAKYAHGSFRATYPVPHPTGIDSGVAFDRAELRGQIWVGSYGDKRRELAAFAADYIEENM